MEDRKTEEVGRRGRVRSKEVVLEKWRLIEGESEKGACVFVLC